jgi:hypothetical protein
MLFRLHVFPRISHSVSLGGKESKEVNNSVLKHSGMLKDL